MSFSYAVIVSGGQVGSVLGAFLATFAGRLGILSLYIVTLGGVALVLVMFFVYVNFSPPTNVESVVNLRKRSTTGFLEGIRLLLTRPYIAGILGEFGLA